METKQRPDERKMAKKCLFNQKIEVRQPLEMLFSKNQMSMENANKKITTF